jgi:hypothetical protein
MLNQLSVVHIFHETDIANIHLQRGELLPVEVLIKAISRFLRVELYKRAVLVLCPIDPDNAHLERVRDEGGAESAEIGVGHVVGHCQHAHLRLPPCREVGRGGGGRVRVDEDDAPGLFDTGGPRGEVN